jgi:hypothetical protein
MQFKLPRQKISQQLSVLATRKIRQNKIYIPKATKDNLRELAAISKEIQNEALPKHLVRKKLKGNLGHGIFLHPCAKPILKGQAIAAYSGEVFLVPKNADDDSCYIFSLISDLLLTKKEQLLMDPKNRFHPRRLYSIDLDAEKIGNFTRFINHSSKPNVEAELLEIPRNSLGLEPAAFEIIYFAKKTIRPGEQLLVSYEGEDKSYWGAMNIKPFPMTPRTFQINESLKIVSKN